MEEKEEQGRQTPAVPTGHTSETAAEGYSFFPASGTFWAPLTSSHAAVPDSRTGRICPFGEGLILLPAFPLPGGLQEPKAEPEHSSRTTRSRPRKLVTEMSSM